MSRYSILDKLASAQEPEFDGTALVKLAYAYGQTKEAGIKDKLLSMVGAQRKPSAAATAGKGALAAGAGAGVLALLQKLMKSQSHGEQLKSLPPATAKAVEKALQDKMGDTPASLLDELKEWGVMGADRA